MYCDIMYNIVILCINIMILMIIIIIFIILLLFYQFKKYGIKIKMQLFLFFFLQGLSKCTQLRVLDVSANRLRIFPAEVWFLFLTPPPPLLWATPFKASINQSQGISENERSEDKVKKKEILTSKCIFMFVRQIYQYVEEVY